MYSDTASISYSGFPGDYSLTATDVIARGVFTSLADLRRKLMKYIRHYNNVPKTVKWRYFDPTNRITSTSAVTVH